MQTSLAWWRALSASFFSDTCSPSAELYNREADYTGLRKMSNIKGIIISSYHHIIGGMVVFLW